MRDMKNVLSLLPEIAAGAFAVCSRFPGAAMCADGAANKRNKTGLQPRVPNVGKLEDKPGELGACIDGIGLVEPLNGLRRPVNVYLPGFGIN